MVYFNRLLFCNYLLLVTIKVTSTTVNKLKTSFEMNTPNRLTLNGGGPLFAVHAKVYRNGAFPTTLQEHRPNMPPNEQQQQHQIHLNNQLPVIHHQVLSLHEPMNPANNPQLPTTANQTLTQPSWRDSQQPSADRAIQQQQCERQQHSTNTNYSLRFDHQHDQIRPYNQQYNQESPLHTNHFQQNYQHTSQNHYPNQVNGGTEDSRAQQQPHQLQSNVPRQQAHEQRNPDGVRHVQDVQATQQPGPQDRSTPGQQLQSHPNYQWYPNQSPQPTQYPNQPHRPNNQYSNSSNHPRHPQHLPNPHQRYVNDEHYLRWFHQQMYPQSSYPPNHRF